MPKHKYPVSENITLNHDNHDKLIKHIVERMNFGDTFRVGEVERFEKIDKSLMGYLRLSEEDRKRELDNKQGKGIKPVASVLPLTLTQVQELVTFLMTIFAPDSGMYGSIAPADKQDVAKAFSILLNHHAKYFGHYSEYVKTILDVARYNKAGLVVEWERRFGNKIGNSRTRQTVEISKEEVYAGNYIEAIDPYNFLYDISVPLTKLSEDGEFFATIKVVRPHKIRKMIEDNKIFGEPEVLDNIYNTTMFYKPKPDIFVDGLGDGTISDWSAVLSASTPDKEIHGVELINYYGWIVPKDYGLSPAKEYQIWRFTMLSDKRIVLAEYLDNAHGMLPVACARAYPDGFENQSKSIAEHLMPYQDAASFRLNTHIAAIRKAIYGINIYNKLVIPDFDAFKGESGSYPANAPSKDFNLKNAFLHITDTADTSNTMQDINMLHELMQLIQPTDMNRQVASLERATQYQAAAVVQGGNRKNYMLARILDESCFIKARMMMQFNVLQYQEAMSIIDSSSGQRTEIDPAQLRDNSDDIDLIPGAGLISIDKLLIIEGLRDVINMLLQSKIANDRIDVVKLIDYWTSLIGDSTDFSLFQFDTPYDKLPVEAKQVAFQLLQQAIQQQQGAGEGTEQPAQAAE